jgi:hypothetical protein
MSPNRRSRYDPEKDLQADTWLAMDESERVAAVESYHRRQRIRLPRATLHATIHSVVENQVALGERAVVEALARLRSEGLTRHEAVHAIGSVLAEQIFQALKSGTQSDMSESYLERVRRLTADEWRQSGETEGGPHAG